MIEAGNKVRREASSAVMRVRREINEEERSMRLRRAEKNDDKKNDDKKNDDKKNDDKKNDDMDARVELAKKL